MLFLTLFFEVRLVARTRFGHAILSLPLSLPHIHSHRQLTLARTGSNWPSFSLKHLCKFFLLFIICLIYLLTPSHTYTLSVSGNRKKKPTKILKDHCASIVHTHTHTLAFTDTVTHATFITSFVLGLTFATRRRRRNDDDDDTNARERS